MGVVSEECAGREGCARMIEFIFTIDYEIYGNGEGSLIELAYKPTEKLRGTFAKFGVPFVLFVDVAELEMMETAAADDAVGLVKDQVRECYANGTEVGLHVHSWWYGASREGGRWTFDYRKYNLCTLPRPEIAGIVDRSIEYLRGVIGARDFAPKCFRSGHLLFQPTQPLASVLAERGIEVDSSVYGGGVWRRHGVDYTRALRNGYYWRFSGDVTVPDPDGVLLEVPVHSRMVPGWRTLTAKRVGAHKRAIGAQNGKRLLERIPSLLGRHPLKLDLCQMTLGELTHMVDVVIREDEEEPEAFRPVVAIGHTKDLTDVTTLESFLRFLSEREISASTLEKVSVKCAQKVKSER